MSVCHIRWAVLSCWRFNFDLINFYNTHAFYQNGDENLNNSEQTTFSDCFKVCLLHIQANENLQI